MRHLVAESLPIFRHMSRGGQGRHPGLFIVGRLQLLAHNAAIRFANLWKRSCRIDSITTCCLLSASKCWRYASNVRYSPPYALKHMKHGRSMRFAI